MWATAREKDVWEMAHRKGIGATHIGIGARAYEQGYMGVAEWRNGSVLDPYSEGCGFNSHW